MRIFAYFLSLAMAVTACGRPVSVSGLVPGAESVRPARAELHMDVDFTESERADAAKATDIWRKQTGGLADIRLVYDLDFNDLAGLNEHLELNHSVVVRRTSEQDSVVAADAEAQCDGCVLGWMNSGGIHAPGHKPIHGAFVVDRFTMPGIQLQVMLHEFGHVLGLPHVEARQAIMYPSVVLGRTQCLKKSDLVAFCDVNECGSTVLYPCE